MCGGGEEGRTRSDTKPKYKGENPLSSTRPTPFLRQNNRLHAPLLSPSFLFSFCIHWAILSATWQVGVNLCLFDAFLLWPASSNTPTPYTYREHNKGLTHTERHMQIRNNVGPRTRLHPPSLPQLLVRSHPSRTRSKVVVHGLPTILPSLFDLLVFFCFRLLLSSSLPPYPINLAAPSLSLSVVSPLSTCRCCRA